MPSATLMRKTEAVAPSSKASAASTSLRIGEPNDAFEQEADRVADEVIAGSGPQWSLSRMNIGVPLQRKCSCGGSGKCEECSKEKSGATLQRWAAGPAAPAVAPSIVHEVLRSPGQPLDSQTRAFFEPRFGHDFSRVRIHTGARAAESALAVNALAYTLGNTIVFGPERDAPEGPMGRRLLAHELAHVVQQNGATSGGISVLAPNRNAEQEAGNASRSVGNAQMPEIRQRISSVQLSRATANGGTPPPPGSAKDGGGAASSVPPNVSGTKPTASGGKPQRLRFDILGADIPLTDFLAKEAHLSRDPDLVVNSIVDMIAKLEAQAPPNSGRCVEHITVYNHANPFGQFLVGIGDKKFFIGSKPSKLKPSGFFLPWLFDAANQGLVARLRNVFCCGAEMHWLGCTTAGVIALGGKRTEEELAASKAAHKERFEDEFSKNEYRSVEDALAHGASLQGAIFGQVNVQSWADATCTSIQAANDFVYHDVNNPVQPYKIINFKIGDKEYKGQFLPIKPSGAGQCSCDAASGRVQGKWQPGQGVELGSSQWQSDLAQFNEAIHPAAGGAPNSDQIKKSLLALITDVAPSLTIPAGLRAGKVEPEVIAPTTEAYTYEHLIFCYPNNFWKWIGVSPFIIQRTPAYTRTALNHELLHAADIQAAAKQYQAAHGAPPSTPPNACVTGYRPEESEPFGRYVADFHRFFQAGLSASRHLEIYAASAAPEFQHFTPAEKVVWFTNSLTAIPENVPPNQPLPTETLVNSVFQKPLAPSEQDTRIGFALELFLMTRGFIYGTEPAPLHEKNLRKARTLINHFDAVWNFYRPEDRGTLIGAIRREGG
jgi:hypothetical protein